MSANWSARRCSWPDRPRPLSMDTRSMSMAASQPVSVHTHRRDGCQRLRQDQGRRRDRRAAFTALPSSKATRCIRAAMSKNVRDSAYRRRPLALAEIWSAQPCGRRMRRAAGWWLLLGAEILLAIAFAMRQAGGCFRIPAGIARGAASRTRRAPRPLLSAGAARQRVRGAGKSGRRSPGSHRGHRRRVNRIADAALKGLGGSIAASTFEIASLALWSSGLWSTS